MGRKGREYWTRTQEIMGESVTVLQENLAGMHVVKAFASEDHESRKYDKKVAELRDQHYKSERLQGTESAWMTLYFTAVLGGLFWYGGLEIINGDITPGRVDYLYPAPQPNQRPHQDAALYSQQLRQGGLVGQETVRHPRRYVARGGKARREAHRSHGRQRPL